VAIGMWSYFAGDINRADAAAAEARRRVLDGDMSHHLLDLLTLQGLIAHNRGEWFDRLRLELRTTQDNAELAVAVFDSHLCVAEYLLYGPTPYGEVVAMAEALRATGRRSGALRAVAFAAALTGEAALLSGDLERAGQELREAADLHHDIGAPAGEALSLQRLAEVRLAQGDRTEANRLLQRALILARWSPMAPHLLQRTFGTMIEAAPDAEAALAVVDRAEGALADRDLCPFCDVMLAVPAAIACSRAGDIERAHRYLRAAEGCVARWEGTAWEAAVLEARGHLAWAEGDTRRATALFAHATELFEAAEQPRDAERCRQTLKTLAANAAEIDR
jgi:tetratricopeptide (TPR) repeat protein